MTMKRFTTLVAAVATCVMVADVVRGADIATTKMDEIVTQIDSMSFRDFVSRTAGEVNPQKIGDYGGDFGNYWKNARVNFEGKTFEAIVADTTNARNKAVHETARLVPNAVLGNNTAPADLLLVKSPGGVPTLVQAKLGADGVLDALGDPKYRGMDIVTCHESRNELDSQLKKEMSKATRRGLPLATKYQRLKDALESGRVWKKLPCGAPLPERSHVEAVSRNHYQGEWNATAKKLAAATDDAALAVATAGTTTPKIPKVATVAKAGGAVDDVVATLGTKVVRCAGPVAIVCEVGYRGYRAYSTEAEFAAGEISLEDREVKHAGNVGGATGGVGGAAGGAYGGAVVGTLICPGIGPVVGGVGGGVGGAIGGSYAGEIVAETAMDAVHATGTTVRGAVRWTGKRLSQTYNYITPW